MDIKILSAYIGNEVNIDPKDGILRPHGNKKMTLTGIQMGWSGKPLYTVYAEDRDKQFTFDPDEVKLILRKLQDISDEDLNELWVYMEWYVPSVEFIRRNAWNQIMAGDPGYSPRFPGVVKVINFLRSRGYDCDSLIEQGFAIEKKKV